MILHVGKDFLEFLTVMWTILETGRVFSTGPDRPATDQLNFLISPAKNWRKTGPHNISINQLVLSRKVY